MAIKDPDFLAETLQSPELLALLYICESKRRGKPLEPSEFSKEKPPEWEELLGTFSERLSTLTEGGRFEVLGAHLMSVEDIDIYDNDALKSVLDENKAALSFLGQELEKDARFALPPAPNT